MSSLQLLLNLPKLVQNKFKHAKTTNALSFYPTEVAVQKIRGLSYQIRFCPALAKKPKSDKPKDREKPFDPFENPAEDLLITQLPPSHVLVLNKFAIVPEHFILATTLYKEQTHLLEEEDLGAAYACLQAWRANGKELFGFFNSGEHSGASQPHRHIQFLPVDSMKEGLGDKSWEPLVDTLSSSDNPTLPFAFFAAALPENPSSGQIHETYLDLLKRACEAVKTYNAAQPERQLEFPTPEENASPISYNLGLTDKSIVLCPRRSEGLSLNIDGIQGSSWVALNGTILGGTLLVKTESEWNALKGDESYLEKILDAIGIPSSIVPSERI